MDKGTMAQAGYVMAEAYRETDFYADAVARFKERMPDIDEEYARCMWRAIDAYIDLYSEESTPGS